MTGTSGRVQRAFGNVRFAINVAVGVAKLALFGVDAALADHLAVAAFAGQRLNVIARVVGPAALERNFLNLICQHDRRGCEDFVSESFSQTMCLQH